MITPRQWIISQKYGKKGAQQIQSQKTKGPQIQPVKVLAGGLLTPGLRLLLKTPAVKKSLKYLKDKTKEKYSFWSRKTGKKKLGTLGKLEIKKRKAMFLKNYAKSVEGKIKYPPSQLKESISKLQKSKIPMGRTTASLTAYDKKISDITKAVMNKPAKIKLHSTGGEVIIGKNVDKDLL